MAARWSYRAIIALTWWCITTTITQAIWLALPDSGTKCVSEDIHNNVVVLADYALINNGGESHLHPSATISVKVGDFHWGIALSRMFSVGLGLHMCIPPLSIFTCWRMGVEDDDAGLGFNLGKMIPVCFYKVKHQILLYYFN